MADDNRILAGKTVLITGASSGIGATAARVFAREGAAVVLTARREERLAALVTQLRAQDAGADYVVADVTRSEDAVRAVEYTVARFGGLDAAFNNAGYGAGRTPLHLMADEVYDEIMETNVRGVFDCLRPEIAAMLDSGAGARSSGRSGRGTADRLEPDR